jgi:DNA-binding beta-propeller fold protein YncE
MSKRALLGFFLVFFSVFPLTAAPASGQSASLLSQTIWGTPAHEGAEGVAVGPDGSTYLTGDHIVGFDPSKIYLVKFAPGGSIAWQQTWDGPAEFFSNNARDVAVSPDGSAVYVTGSSFINPNVAVLLKFNPADGSLVWDRSWGGNANPEGVAVDDDGSIYVAGSVRGAVNQQIFITKFAADGSVLWHRVWNTPESRGETQGSDVAIDEAGNVYVSGVTARPDPDLPGEILGFDIALLKLDAAGNLIWQRTVGAGEQLDSRGGLAIGPDGTVYVAGARADARTSDFDAAVLKFGADGSLLWARTWGGRAHDEAGGIIVGGDGTAYVAGSTSSFGNADDAYFLAIGSDGKGRDAATWGGPLIDHGTAIDINPDGDVVIGAVAEEPPYAFLRARARTSKEKTVLGVPDFPLVSADSGVMDAGGTVAPIAGTTNDDPGFDAALLIIRP